MLRFLAFLLTFLIGGAIGFVVGGLGGAGAGAIAGTCSVIDTGVNDGTLTQEQANTLVKGAVDKLDLGTQRAAILEQTKKALQPGPCLTALQTVQ